MTHANLTELGIPPIDPDAQPNAYAAVLRAARQLRLSDRRTIGFFPTETRVAVLPLLLQLSLALSEHGKVPIALLDVNARFPALGTRARERAADDEGMVAIELDTSVQLFTPRRARGRAFSEAEFSRLIEKKRDHFRHVLVDLTGLEQEGEHLFGFRLVDATVLVAHARSTHEYALVLAARQVPAERQLGVLLVG
ncbi:MAG TPA: hypothetical protein VM686_16165 [Polyangiaceae bacterium]|jgi:hypothetical protein|nr:hypothetical protein [Polyangiaceae bacterium]